MVLPVDILPGLVGGKFTFCLPLGRPPRNTQTEWSHVADFGSQLSPLFGHKNPPLSCPYVRRHCPAVETYDCRISNRAFLTFFHSNSMPHVSTGSRVQLLSSALLWSMVLRFP